jgi:anti-sigma factor (TIGR02949 family)
VNARPSWWRRMAGSRDVASCLEVGSVLQAYLDGEVDEVTARRVARHLEACRRCGLEAATYTDIKDALARRSSAVPEDAVDRLRRFGERLIEHPDAAADEPDADGGGLS